MTAAFTTDSTRPFAAIHDYVPSVRPQAVRTSKFKSPFYGAKAVTGARAIIERCSSKAAKPLPTANFISVVLQISRTSLGPDILGLGLQRGDAGNQYKYVSSELP